MFGWRRKRGGGGSGDPGPSPVAWLSDEIWRLWNDGDPEARSLKVASKPIAEAWPTPVTDDDRRRAGRGQPPAGAPLPAPGTVPQHAALLASTPGVGHLSLVRWPVCCERLTTLISDGGSLPLGPLEREVGPLDLALTEAHLPPNAAGATSDRERFEREGGWIRTLSAMRAGKHGGDGMALFQCRACGRVYGATCEP